MTASWRSWVALQIVSKARKCVAAPLRRSDPHGRAEHLADLQRFGHQHRRLIGAADALQIDVGIEARRARRPEPRDEGLAIAAVPDVVADDRGFVLVEHDEVAAARKLQRLRGRRPGLFVLHLAVDDGGEAVLRVARDVLPHVQHRPAGGIHERAALSGQLRHFLDGDPERRQDHDVFCPQRLAAFARVREEPDAVVAQALVDVRVVDDFAGQEDVPPRESPPRLIGVVDSPVDAVAEAEFAGEVQREPAGGELIVAGADLVDDGAVVGRRELACDGLFHVEALTEDERGSGHLPDYRRPRVTAGLNRGHRG